MSAPVVDYLKSSLDDAPQPALTPGSTPADAAGLVEVLRLITDPKAHQKHLTERQEIAAAWARLRSEQREMRQAAAVQAAELARLRQEFDAAMVTDRENQIAENSARKAALAAQVAELLAALDRIDRGDD